MHVRQISDPIADSSRNDATLADMRYKAAREAVADDSGEGQGKPQGSDNPETDEGGSGGSQFGILPSLARVR